MFAWGKFLTTTKISTLALFEGFFQCNFRRFISTFFSFCFKQACFSGVQKSLILQKCLFSRASCMFHSHRPARCSSRILQKDVGASNLEGASPSPYLIFFNQPQFGDCDNCDIYDVSATLRMRSSLTLNFAQWMNFWDTFLVLVPNFKQSAGKY